MMNNRHHRIYVGATTDLVDRVRQHRNKTYPNAFTARYDFYRLVYFEPLPTFEDALRRETQIKAWRREKKVALIQEKNPNWRDLSASYSELLETR
jgi:putative endonuclease